MSIDMSDFRQFLRIDWSIIALDICQPRTMTKRDKARKCRMGPVQLDRIKNGQVRAPRWDQGILLLALHRALCEEKHSPDRIMRYL